MSLEAKSLYVINAKAPEGIVQQTRVQAASALVLAQSWQERGYADVEVIAPTGVAITPEQYRAAVTSSSNRLGRRAY